MDQSNRTPAPVPEGRAFGTPPADTSSTSAVAVTVPVAPAVPPVALVRHLTAPPLLYLRHSTLLV
jgi:hypothetical protein